MIQLEHEISYLKSTYLEMHDLVRNQVLKTKKAVLERNKEIAQEVIRRERKVNMCEVNIDEEVEKFMALNQPVATDLRIAIAILKMSGNLERIGDHAYKISCLMYEDEMSLSEKIIKQLKIERLFDEIDQMMANVAEAFVKQDVKLAKAVFKQDRVLNRMNKKVPERLSKYALKEKKETIGNLIMVSNLVGKLERTGDLIKNQSEEIIFYIESELIKHKKKNKRIKKMIK